MATIYIDPDVAGPGSGTASDPYDSWTRVTFSANDIYVQKRGTTDALAAQFSVSSAASTTLSAYGTGAAPIISNSEATNHHFTIIGAGQTLSNLRFTMSSPAANRACINVSAGNAITIDSCQLAGSSDGIRLTGAGHTNLNTIRNTSIDDTDIDAILYGSGATGGLYVVGCVGTGIGTSGSDGDFVQSSATSGRHDVRRNHATLDASSTKQCVLLTNNGETAEVLDNTLIEGNQNVNVQGATNILRNDMQDSSSRNINLNPAADDLVVVVEGNAIADSSKNSLGAIYIEGATKVFDITIAHNTVANDVKNLARYAGTSGSGSMVAYNNLVHNSGVSTAVIGLLDVGTGTPTQTNSNNAYFNLSATHQDWTASGGGDVTADPKLINATTDLRLDGDSPCIGAGTKYWAFGSQPHGQDGLRFPLRSGAPDIGAYALRPGEDGACRKATAILASVLEAGVDIAKAKAA